VEALANEGDEVVSSALSCEDLEPIAEPINHKTEVVTLQGEEVGADVLEWVPGCIGVIVGSGDWLGAVSSHGMQDIRLLAMNLDLFGQNRFLLALSLIEVVP
jgi:hypothetical protein